MESRHFGRPSQIGILLSIVLEVLDYKISKKIITPHRFSLAVN